MQLGMLMLEGDWAKRGTLWLFLIILSLQMKGKEKNHKIPHHLNDLVFGLL